MKLGEVRILINMTHKRIKQNSMKMLKRNAEKNSKTFIVSFKGKQALFCPCNETFVVLATNILIKRHREKYFFTWLLVVVVYHTYIQFSFSLKKMKRKTNFKTLFVLYNSFSVLSFLLDFPTISSFLYFRSRCLQFLLKK